MAAFTSSESSEDSSMQSVDNEQSPSFTLEDTYSSLNEKKSELIAKINDLLEIVNNNEIKTCGPETTSSLIQRKRLKYIRSLVKVVEREQPKNLPVPCTPDFYASCLTSLEAEVKQMKKLTEALKKENDEKEQTIAELERKKLGFDEVFKSLSKGIDDERVPNYEDEMAIVKTIFRETRNDLTLVVETLFPPEFQDFLCELTKAKAKGGEDLFIPILPEHVVFANTLEEAGIIQYHAHTKGKCRLRDF